jgi:hypothetical protein
MAQKSQSICCCLAGRRLVSFRTDSFVRMAFCIALCRLTRSCDDKTRRLTVKSNCKLRDMRKLSHESNSILVRQWVLIPSGTRILLSLPHIQTGFVVFCASYKWLNKAEQFWNFLRTSMYCRGSE